MIRPLRLIALACVLVLLCLDGVKAASAPMLLSVDPTTSIDATLIVGQPAKSFTYRLTASRGNINWSYTGPSWLRASSVSGKTPATITLTTASGLQPGTYSGVFLFQGNTNGVVLSARLVVASVAAPPPTKSGCPGYILGNAGMGYLTTNGGDRLIC